MDEQDKGDDQARGRQIVVFRHRPGKNMRVEEQRDQHGVEDHEKGLQPRTARQVAGRRHGGDADREIADDDDRVHPFCALVAAEQEVCEQDGESDEAKQDRTHFAGEVPMGMQ